LHPDESRRSHLRPKKIKKEIERDRILAKERREREREREMSDVRCANVRDVNVRFADVHGTFLV